MVLDFDIDMVSFGPFEPVIHCLGHLDQGPLKSDIGWLMSIGCFIAALRYRTSTLICQRLSSHTHGRLVNGEILIYRRRAAPFKFEAS